MAPVSPRDVVLSPRLPPRQVLEPLKFRKRFMNSLKPDSIGNRSDWLRFVIVRAEAGNVGAMMPRIAPGAVLMPDRHYNSLEQYHRGTPNLYAARVGEQCAIGYVAVASGRVILRPHDAEWPVELVGIGTGRSFAEYIHRARMSRGVRGVTACAPAR